MLGLGWAPGRRGAPRVLCFGAHPDDIEIGCGGTLLRLRRAHRGLECVWVVLSGDAARAAEARRSARRLLPIGKRLQIVVRNGRDGFLPYVAAPLKEFFEELKRTVEPDVIFTHYGNDRHQDHRLISELTWNTFRRHLILEYEIPKWDGDLGSPNVFVPLSPAVRGRKIRHLRSAFPSQRSKPWFSDETFLGLMRLRGVESGAPEGYAEAFYARKLVAQG